MIKKSSTTNMEFHDKAKIAIRFYRHNRTAYIILRPLWIKISFFPRVPSALYWGHKRIKFRKEIL